MLAKGINLGYMRMVEFCRCLGFTFKCFKKLNICRYRWKNYFYGYKPAERFVFINMSKYWEGDTLKEGPSIDAITDRGVVLCTRAGVLFSRASK